MKIIDRVRRARRRARRHAGGDDLRSASAARRPARQGAAAADDRRSRSSRRWRTSGMQGVAVVRFTRELSQLGARDVRPDRAGRVAARRRSVGRRELSLRPRSRRQLLACCARLGARYGFRAEKIDPVRYKDFVVSSTRVRRLVAEGRVDEAGALLGHHYFIDGTVVHGAGRGRELGFPTANLADRERAAAAGRRLCDDVAIDGIVHPSVTNIGTAADVRRRRPPVDRDPHLRRRRAICTIDACGCRSCSGCATSARLPTSTRCARRSTPTAAARGGCSAAFRCRIVSMSAIAGPAPMRRVCACRFPCRRALRRHCVRPRRASGRATLGERAPDARSRRRRAVDGVGAARRRRRRARRPRSPSSSARSSGELAVEAHCAQLASSEVRQSAGPLNARRVRHCTASRAYRCASTTR